MRKSLATLALAAAVTLPAAGAMTVATTPAQAAKAQFQRVKPHVNARINRHHINPNLQLTLRRCYKPSRWLYVSAKRILLRRGFRKIRYAGYRRGGHCTQRFYFSACRGFRRYRVVVSFRFGRYIGMYRRVAGRCFPYRGGHLRHRS